MNYLEGPTREKFGIRLIFDHLGGGLTCHQANPGILFYCWVPSLDQGDHQIVICLSTVRTSFNAISRKNSCSMPSSAIFKCQMMFSWIINFPRFGNFCIKSLHDFSIKFSLLWIIPMSTISFSTTVFTKCDEFWSIPEAPKFSHQKRLSWETILDWLSTWKKITTPILI